MLHAEGNNTRVRSSNVSGNTPKAKIILLFRILVLCVFARLWNDSRHGNKGKGQKNNQFVCISILWRNVYFKTKTSKTLEISNICKPNTIYISFIEY